jgi:hypothetical protein
MLPIRSATESAEASLDWPFGATISRALQQALAIEHWGHILGLTPPRRVVR